MKKIYKLLLLSLFVTYIGCDDTDERFEGADLESGWVELTVNSTTTGATDSSVSIPVNVTAPRFSDFNLDYVITPVSGDVTNYVSELSGNYTVTPVDGSEQRIFSIDILLENMDAIRDEEAVFDVTLTNSSNPNISLGLSDGSRNLTQRVTIPCNEPKTLSELLTYNPDYLTGDFNLAGGDQSDFPLAYFGDEPQLVTLFPGLSPTERVFDVILLPGAFNIVRTVTLELIEDETAGITLVFKGSFTSGVGCGGIPSIFQEYVIDGEDDTQADIEYTQLSVCGGLNDSYTVNYFEETQGTCGAVSQFSNFSLSAL